MAGSRATATAADKKPFSRLAQTSPSIGAKRSLAISNFAATEARSLQSTHFDNNDVKCPTQIMGHSDRRIWKPVKVCTNCCCRPSGPSTTLQHLRFNHVEIVAIVALLDDRLLGRYLALEHGVQHLVHLRVTKANPNITSIWPRAVADTKTKNRCAPGPVPGHGTAEYFSQPPRAGCAARRSSGRWRWRPRRRPDRFQGRTPRRTPTCGDWRNDG